MSDDKIYQSPGERNENRESERRQRRLKLAGWVQKVGILMTGVVAGVGALQLQTDLGTDKKFFAALIGGIASACVGLVIVIYNSRIGDIDQSQRAVMADFEQFERNVKQDVIRIVRREFLDKNAPSKVILSEVQKRVDDALVSSIDEALQRRLTDGAKSVDVITYIDEIQARVLIALEGPAGRAESRSTGLMWGAIVVGILGLVIAVVRVFSLGDYSANLLLLNKQLGSRSVWPYVFALSTPWVTLVALVEFSALILLKLSNQFSLLQRQYTELLVEENARFLALKAIVRFGEADQVVAASNLFIRNKQPVESKDEIMQESISAISKLTENLAGIVKQFVGKDGKPAA